MALLVGNGLDLNNKKIVRLGDPSAPTDGVNKQYVDALVRGLSWKLAVVAATTGNGDLATGFAAGATLDGVVLAEGDRILIKDQTDATENGIYVVADSGAPTRALDADSADELRGATVTVTKGTVNADRVYRLVTDDIVLGTTDLHWTEIGGAAQPYVAGAGLVESPANTFNVGAGAGISVSEDTVSLASSVAGAGLTYSSGVLAVGGGLGILVDADLIRIDTSVVARKYVTDIGNGSSSDIVVTHNLGTRDVTVTIRSTSSPYEVLLTDVECTDANSITIKFGSPPAVGQYRVTVVG